MVYYYLNVQLQGQRACKDFGGNLEATSKFQDPERCYETSDTLRTQKWRRHSKFVHLCFGTQTLYITFSVTFLIYYNVGYVVTQTGFKLSLLPRLNFHLALYIKSKEHSACCTRVIYCEHFSSVALIAKGYEEVCSACGPVLFLLMEMFPRICVPFQLSLYVCGFAPIMCQCCIQF